MPDIRSFYTSVLSQAFSPCEDFLAAGTNFGNVNIFSVAKKSDDGTSESNPTDDQSQPLRYFSVSKKSVQGLVSFRDTLIVGGKNSLLGYNWDHLKQGKGLGKDVKPTWTADLHLPGDFGSKETIDYITLDDSTGTAYVACGDNCIYRVDLEYGKITSCFTAHEDFIHSMSLYGNQLSSASEDGTVCLWDTKRAKCIHKILPHSESRLQRPKLGKWIGAVTMNDDWLVCGGGPHLALYHLRSLTLSRVLLEDDQYAVNSVMFNEDTILVGMDGPFVYHVLFSGDVTYKTPTTPLRVYSLAQQKGERKLLTVGGAGAGIDICLSSKFQDQVVNCVS